VSPAQALLEVSIPIARLRSMQPEGSKIDISESLEFGDEIVDLAKINLFR